MVSKSNIIFKQLYINKLIPIDIHVDTRMNITKYTKMIQNYKML